MIRRRAPDHGSSLQVRGPPPLVLFASALASQSGRLSGVTSSALAETLPAGAESLEVVRATAQFGDDQSSAIVVYYRDDGLSDADRRRVRDDRRQLDESPPPLAVEVGRPQIEQGTGVIAVSLREPSDNDATGAAVEALRARVASTAARAPASRSP